MTKEYIKDFPLNKLTPYEKNPRRNDHAVDVLIKEMEAVGNNDPIEVNEDYVILAGHTRLKALKKLGKTATDILIISGLTEEQQKRYRITSNKTGELAEWDFEILEADFDIDELESMGFDLKIKEEKEVEIQDNENFYMTFLTDQSQRSFIEGVLNLYEGENNTEKLLKLCQTK